MKTLDQASYAQQGAVAMTPWAGLIDMLARGATLAELIAGLSPWDR